MTILVYSLSIFLMIFFPVALAALLRRRYPAPWLLFCAGMLTFIGSQVVHLPLNNWLTHLGILPQSVTGSTIPLWRTAVILGLSAGLCEELARAVGYLILKRWRHFEHGVMLGLGHGGIESMVFGAVQTAAAFSALWGLRNSDLTTLNLAPDQLSALTAQVAAVKGTALIGFVPLFERILAVSLHVVLSLIVLQAFRKKNVLYVAAAVLYHALVDAGAVYIMGLWANTWLVYGAFIVVLLPGLVWLAAQVRRQPAPARLHKSAWGAELKVFGLALRKELTEQWRSRRVLVIAAVFILFGMGSPLLAKFLPEIMKNISGAEAFAGLIPVPTIADAFGQYTKNLTQFGFILAVLLGMSSVVGEKERGTVAMILSKPMPRWAFLLSKFTAQSLVYLLAFVVAGLGASYYTYVLFGSFGAGPYAMINLLLLVWLLTFVGVTLLGSVLGGSTGAAAGIGLGLSVVLLFSSNLPKVGTLAPGGLTAWAGQIGADAATVSANGGALAMAVVIVLASILVSLALFERQEL